MAVLMLRLLCIRVVTLVIEWLTTWLQTLVLSIGVFVVCSAWFSLDIDSGLSLTSILL